MAPETSEGYEKTSCIFILNEFYNQLPLSTALLWSRPLLITVWSLDQQFGVTRELVRNAESQAPPWLSPVKICILTRSPGDVNAGVWKAKPLLCGNTLLSHSSLLSAWGTPWKVASCLSRCLWKEHLNIRHPGWRQLSTHHWSINAAFSGNYWTSLLPACSWHLHVGLTPFLQWGRFSPRSTYFLCFCTIRFSAEWKSFEWSVFLKRAPTAFLKVECTCHSAACNCRESCGWPGTAIGRSAVTFCREVYRLRLYTHEAEKKQSR